jgi:hypothetical protein
VFFTNKKSTTKPKIATAPSLTFFALVGVLHQQEIHHQAKKS